MKPTNEFRWLKKTVEENLCVFSGIMLQEEDTEMVLQQKWVGPSIDLGYISSRDIIEEWRDIPIVFEDEEG